jgi:hypothetical protein
MVVFHSVNVILTVRFFSFSFFSWGFVNRSREAFSQKWRESLLLYLWLDLVMCFSLNHQLQPGIRKIGLNLSLTPSTMWAVHKIFICSKNLGEVPRERKVLIGEGGPNFLRIHANG